MSLAWVTADDAPALALLHAQAFDSPWDEAAFRGLLGGPGVFGLIADGGLILCRVVFDEMEILTLGVAPEARRRGVARALVASSLAAAAEAGAKAAFLEVADDNAAAASLYASLGFRRAGLRRGYYDRGPAGRADALVMRLGLDEGLA